MQRTGAPGCNDACIVAAKAAGTDAPAASVPVSAG